MLPDNLKGSRPDGATVHHDVNGMPPRPRHAGRVDGERKRRLEVNSLARPERDAAQLEHSGRSHPASLHEVHGHIDQQLLPTR